MKLESIKAKLESLKNGTCANITYKSELPLKAEFKKKGFVIEKVTTKVVRFGVDYDNIKSVIERRADENYKPVERENNYVEIVKDKLYHNNKTNNDYLRFSNFGSQKVKAYFKLNGEIVTELPKEYVIPSYFNKNGSIPEVQNIKIDNVLEINSEVMA